MSYPPEKSNLARPGDAPKNVLWGGVSRACHFSTSLTAFCCSAHEQDAQEGRIAGTEGTVADGLGTVKTAVSKVPDGT